jgi:hypothetical protein
MKHFRCSPDRSGRQLQLCGWPTICLLTVQITRQQGLTPTMPRKLVMQHYDFTTDRIVIAA